MKIQKLHIQHYKSIEDEAVFQNFSNLNIFIGQNNSGKTNILDAIQYLLQKKNDERFQDDKAHLSADISLTPKQRANLSQTLGIDSPATFRIQAKDGDLLKNNISWDKFFSSHFVRLGIDRLMFSEKKYLNAYKDLTENYPTQTKQFQQILQKYFPEIDLTSVPTKFEEFGQERVLTRLGSGFSQFFVILLYLYHPRYDIILIDEPEAHLHPGLLKKLMQELKNQSLRNQIFLTTHSPILVKTYNLEHLYRVERNKHAKSSKIYSFRDSRSIISERRLVQELNSDNSEMFFADKVLLVEGVSDRILLRALINKFYSGTKMIKVIYTSGKDNVDVYIDLLKIFHIPYVVLLDRDALRGIGIKALNRVIGKKKRMKQNQAIGLLKEHNIYVFPNGAIEDNYPKKYQRKDKKPLNALYAATKITEQDFHSKNMRHVKEVLDKVFED